MNHRRIVVHLWVETHPHLKASQREESREWDRGTWGCREEVEEEGLVKKTGGLRMGGRARVSIEKGSFEEEMGNGQTVQPPPLEDHVE